MGPFVAEVTYFTYYCANDKNYATKKSCLTMANAFHINVTALVHPVCCGRKKLVWHISRLLLLWIMGSIAL